MNAAIKGTSAGGKSEIRKRLLAFFPPEDIVNFTSLNEKALLYYEGDFSHKILSMGEAAAADEQSFQDYLLRELMSERRLVHRAPQKVGNEIVTVTIEKNGPVVFLVTTTKDKLHEENETRLTSLQIDDSESQTRQVLDMVAQVDGLRDTATIDYEPWQNFQRWLAAGECRVVVPFAEVLSKQIPPVAVRLRRDFGQVLSAVKAHALLHRDQRDSDDAGRIIADIENDYETVRKLTAPIVAQGSGVAVSAAMMETIAAVAKATAGMPEGADAKAIAKLLKLDRSATWRRLSVACDDGYIVNMEQRRRMPGKYRVTGQEAEPVEILPKAEDLSAKFAHTPPESVHSCNRDEIADISLRDNECKDECKPSAECAGTSARVHTSANTLALVISLDGKEKLPPSARVHDFSGGTDDFYAFPPVCDHCGAPANPNRRSSFAPLAARNTGCTGPVRRSG
jgi:hypothetical protein